MDHESSYQHLIVDQNWANYTATEHETWKILFERQMKILEPRICHEYLSGLDHLGFTADRIPKFDEVNERLKAITGWQVVATEGLVKSKAFFDMLKDRKFPAGYFIRSREQLDYLEEPDILHDLFGHIPLLTHPPYADYMHEYGVGGERALQYKTTKNLARLNWWTIEFGLIRQDDRLKIYGAGLVSSYTEAKYCLDDPSPHHLAFNLDRCMRTRVYINDFQPCYFVIDSFEQLFHQAAGMDFTNLYQDFKGLEGHQKAGEYLPFDIVEGDVVIRKGTQAYINPKRDELERNLSI